MRTLFVKRAGTGKGSPFQVIFYPIAILLYHFFEKRKGRGAVPSDCENLRAFHAANVQDVPMDPGSQELSKAASQFAMADWFFAAIRPYDGSQATPVIKKGDACRFFDEKRGRKTALSLMDCFAWKTYLPNWQSLLPLSVIHISSMLIGSLKSATQPAREMSKLPALRSARSVSQSRVRMVMLMPTAARSC